MAKSLGSIGFRKRGEFKPNTFYRMDDMFKHGRSTYYVLEDFTSGETFEETADKVELLADATGVEEIAQRAENAASLAETNGAEAGVQAEEARNAAAEANKQAETAREVAGVFGSNFKKVINDQFLYAISDLLGNLLWGIRKDGSTYDPKGVPEMVKKLIEEEAIVEIKKKHPSRSISQNAYLHVILGYFGQEFGYDIDTVKYEYFKKLCNPQIFIKKRTNKRGTEVEYLRSTADLNTAEMTLAIERFRNWASAEAHIYLPAPNEYEHLLYAQQMIEQNEEFL